jgi:1-aminocyclopropane-1-carboxylate deaminase/D-cysteine desulfhydrase-like pyridoxal-dependent ACC family enzyme
VLVLRGSPSKHVNGNLLLDHLLGAKVIFTGERPRDEVMEEVAESERAAGRTPYPIPIGGSVRLAPRPTLSL